MSFTQFSMVEELASLVKDNIPCKYMILSVEDLLVNFLQDDTSSDAVLELEPMNSYNRLLVHRLADIFGFAHQSVGEGEDRHLVLERCPETSMPGILVSDFLQSGEEQPPMIFDVLRRKEVMPAQNVDAVGGPSLEEREATYFAARERIFLADTFDTKLVKERPKKDPVVARRMITRALGQTNKAIKHECSSSDTMECAQTAKDVKTLYVDESYVNSSSNLGTKSFPAKHSRPCTTSEANESREFKMTNSSSKGPKLQNNLKLRDVGSTAEGKSDDNYLKKEHAGAAKRLFANALGVHRRESRDVNQSKFCETKKTDS